MIGEFPHQPDWTSPALERFDGIALMRDLPFDEVAIRMSDRLVYLATPYTKLAVDEAGRFSLLRSIDAQKRATMWAARFAASAITAVAPITLAGDIIYHDQLRRDARRLDPLDHVFWEAWCAPLLSRCDAVVIPPIPGWAESTGVWREAVAALAVGKQVLLIGEGE